MRTTVMRFLSKLTLNQPPSEEITALTPAEESRGKELAEQGIREAVYVAAERSAVWTVWNYDSPEVLGEVTKTLPRHEFWSIEGTRLADEIFERREFGCLTSWTCSRSS